MDMNEAQDHHVYVPVTSQPINEGGQSPGTPRCWGPLIICKYFYVGTLHTKLSLTGSAVTSNKDI